MLIEGSGVDLASLFRVWYQSSQQHLLKRLFLSNVHFWHLCPESHDRGVWFHSGSSSTSTYMSIVCQSRLLCHPAPVLEFEITYWLWYLQRFLLRNALDIWHPLCSIWILVFFFSFCKDCHWNFDGGTIKCVFLLIKIVFIIFILPIHEHKSTFCFL